MNVDVAVEEWMVALRRVDWHKLIFEFFRKLNYCYVLPMFYLPKGFHTDDVKYSPQTLEVVRRRLAELTGLDFMIPLEMDSVKVGDSNRKVKCFMFFICRPGTDKPFAIPTMFSRQIFSDLTAICKSAGWVPDESQLVANEDERTEESKCVIS